MENAKCKKLEDISTELVNIEVSDWEDDLYRSSFNNTSLALRMCRKQVLIPYRRLLIFIGWRGFAHFNVNGSNLRYRFLNFIYSSLMILFLLYAYTYDSLFCRWKLNVRTDTQIIQTAIPITTTTCVHNKSSEGNEDGFSAMFNDMIASPLKRNQCDHLITTYVLPNVMHFIVYIIGWFFYRWKGTEEMYSAMEKAFLQSTSQSGSLLAQNRMIRKLRIYLGLACLWLASTMVVHVLYALAFGFSDNDYFLSVFNLDPEIHLSLRYTLFGVATVGVLLKNAVTTAVIVNYCVLAETVVFLLHATIVRLTERNVNIRSIMKSSLTAFHSTVAVNGIPATMTAITLTTCAELVVVGTSILILNENNHPLVWSYRILFPLIWLIVFVVPLVQGCRIHNEASRLRAVALETRLFGHLTASILELDSFLSFVWRLPLRAKLFRIPLKAHFLIAFTVVVCFITLILFQTGNVSGYIANLGIV